MKTKRNQQSWCMGVGLMLCLCASAARAADETPAAKPETPASLAAELALVVPPPPTAAGDAFAIFLSGDGGWAALDREVSRRLTDKGLPVIGWNSRAYYWKRKTPEAAGAALGRIIATFAAEWKRPHVVLVGYSRGADVLPFLVDHLPGETRAAIRRVVLLGPGPAIDFEFHLTDWVHDPDPKTALPVVPEIETMVAAGVPTLIVCARDDSRSPTAELTEHVPGVVVVDGDHHFDRAYDRLAGIVLDGLSPD
jgi:type IV secretory pathway VirJ component